MLNFGRDIKRNIAKVHRIKIAKADDVKALAQQLAEDSEYSGWQERDLIGYLDKENYGFLIIGDQPSGFIIYSHVLGEVEIIMLWIAKNRRKMGYGSAILNELLKISRANQNSAIFLEVAMDNEKAISLYRANGFKEVGNRRAYYTRANGETMDAAIMRYSFE